MITERDITKSIDFLVGYCYKELEKRVVKALCIDKEEDFPVEYEISIPWAWCTQRCRVSHLSVDMWTYEANNILLKVGHGVLEELTRAFPNQRLIGSAFVNKSDKGWRSDISFVINQEPKPVEMTIEEIEAKLGYKIKIIGDK